MSSSNVSRASSQSSASSPSSITTDSTSTTEPTSSTTPPKSKRTRKRFTQSQLILLEQVFHRTSHPTREEREAVAERAAMDIKSVTIWFQNKRQIERKVALNNSTNRSNVSAPPPMLTLYPPSHKSSEYPADTRRRPFHPTRPLGSSASLPNALRARPSNGFLTLDRIASRAELSTHAPRTPTKLTRHASHSDLEAVWEAMPSSPIQPTASPCSPFSRDILDFSSKTSSRATKPSLEWACAAARFAVKVEHPKTIQGEHRPPPSFDADSVTSISDDKTECDDTEVEDNHEAITPDASQSDVDWDETFPSSLSLEPCENEKSTTIMNPIKDKDDIMTAAYALCGLSRG